MLNYEIDAAVLRPLVPRGTKLAAWQGRHFVSVVGFQFLDTRVLGVPIPLHRDFPEVNLRFYVQREAGGEVRHGVVFLKEMVPRLAIALTARTMFDEPYQALPMACAGPAAADSAGTMSYRWRRAGTWESLDAKAEDPPFTAAPGSHEAFITEQSWGYTSRKGKPSNEYRVEHPRWRLRKASAAALNANVAALYGTQFAGPLAAQPYSAFVANGSAVAVYPPARIT